MLQKFQKIHILWFNLEYTVSSIFICNFRYIPYIAVLPVRNATERVNSYKSFIIFYHNSPKFNNIFGEM